MDNTEQLIKFMDDKFYQLTRHMDDKFESQGKLFDNKIDAQNKSITELQESQKQTDRDISEAKGSIKMFKYLLGILILIASVIIGILQYSQNDDMQERLKHGINKSHQDLNN